MKRRIFLGFITILLGALLLCVLIGYVSYTKPNQLDIQMEEVNMFLDSEELTASFQRNEIFASSIYTEKVIEISGVVEEVSSANDRVTVFLKGNEESLSILSDFSDESKEQALLLTKGQDIVVKGICKGFLKDVIVLNCIIVKP